jgi:hypothetical protein
VVTHHQLCGDTASAWTKTKGKERGITRGLPTLSVDTIRLGGCTHTRTRAHTHTYTHTHTHNKVVVHTHAHTHAHTHTQ